MREEGTQPTAHVLCIVPGRDSQGSRAATEQKFSLELHLQADVADPSVRRIHLSVDLLGNLKVKIMINCRMLLTFTSLSNACRYGLKIGGSR